MLNRLLQKAGLSINPARLRALLYVGMIAIPAVAIVVAISGGAMAVTALQWVGEAVGILMMGVGRIILAVFAVVFIILLAIYTALNTPIDKYLPEKLRL